MRLMRKASAAFFIHLKSEWICQIWLKHSIEGRMDFKMLIKY